MVSVRYSPATQGDCSANVVNPSLETASKGPSFEACRTVTPHGLVTPRVFFLPLNPGSEDKKNPINLSQVIWVRLSETVTRGISCRSPQGSGSRRFRKALPEAPLTILRRRNSNKLSSFYSRNDRSLLISGPRTKVKIIQSRARMRESIPSVDEIMRYPSHMDSRVRENDEWGRG